MTSSFTETFRGDVKPWECDVVEHFTVAYYYEKFEAATWRYLSGRHLAGSGVDPAEARTAGCYTRYHAELRKGDLFHIETGLTTAGPRPVITHRLHNSTTGTLCTVMEQTLEGVSLQGPVSGQPPVTREERAPVPDTATWICSGMDVVRPGQLDWAGRLGIAGLIHQFSGSGFHALAHIGMTPAYLRDNRRGFSTFEFRITSTGWPCSGTPVHVESTIAHVGSSSIRMVHRFIDSMQGTEMASLDQFGVQLDLDARKPARLPDPVREKARALLGA